MTLTKFQGNFEHRLGHNQSGLLWHCHIECMSWRSVCNGSSDGSYLESGPCLNIKTVFPSYGDSHVKDNAVMVVRPSYLQHGDTMLVRRHLYVVTPPRILATLLEIFMVSLELLTNPCFYQTRSAWSIEWGSNEIHFSVYSIAPTHPFHMSQYYITVILVDNWSMGQADVVWSKGYLILWIPCHQSKQHKSSPISHIITLIIRFVILIN